MALLCTRVPRGTCCMGWKGLPCCRSAQSKGVVLGLDCTRTHPCSLCWAFFCQQLNCSVLDLVASFNPVGGGEERGRRSTTKYYLARYRSWGNSVAIATACKLLPQCQCCMHSVHTMHATQASLQVVWTTSPAESASGTLGMPKELAVRNPCWQLHA